MSAYLVSYDLNNPGKNYDALYERIKAYGTYLHLLDSAWIVISTASAQQVTDHLYAALDSGDDLFVVDISGQARQGWLSKTKWEWIDKHV